MAISFPGVVRAHAGLAIAALVIAGCNGPVAMTEDPTSTTGEDTEGTSTTGPPLEPKEWEMSLEVGEEVGAFFGVWGPSSDDVIACGGQVNAGQIWRYDGESWAPDEVMFPIPRMNWVYGVDGYTVMVGHFGYAMHLDEDNNWVRDMTPLDAALWGVWGSSKDDLWAVGGPTGPEDPPVVLHWDGMEWTQEVLPPLMGEGRSLFKVWGTGPDDVFAVGDRGMILHYDGGTWTEEDSGTLSSIIGVWGHADYDVVIAGGRSSGLVARRGSMAQWYGKRYLEHEGFDGVFVDDDGITTVVGRRGFVGRYVPFSLEPVIEPTPTVWELHSVYGFDDGTLFVVGGFFDSSPYTGVILRRPPD